MREQLPHSCLKTQQPLRALIFCTLVFWATGVQAAAGAPHGNTGRVTDDAHRRTPGLAFTFAAALERGDEAPSQRARRDALRVRRGGDRAISGQVRGGRSLIFSPSLRVAADVGPELQIYAGRSFGLGGRSAARRAAARAERQVMAASAAAALYSRRLRVADAWIELWAAQTARSWLQQQRTLAISGLRLAQRARRVGAGQRAEEADAKVWLAELKLTELARRHKAHHAALRLARLLGLPPTPLLRASGPAPQPNLPAWSTSPLAHDAVQRRIKRLPLVHVARMQWLSRRAQRLEKRANSAAILSVGSQVEIDSPFGAVGRLQIGLSWSADGASARARSALRAREIAAKHQVGIAQLAAQHDVIDALHAAKHSAASLRVLEAELLPALSQRVTLLQRRLHRGEALRANLLTTQQRWLIGQRALNRSRAGAVRARLRAWLLTTQLSDPSDIRGPH